MEFNLAVKGKEKRKRKKNKESCFSILFYIIHIPFIPYLTVIYIHVFFFFFNNCLHVYLWLMPKLGKNPKTLIYFICHIFVFQEGICERVCIIPRNKEISKIIICIALGKAS